MQDNIKIMITEEEIEQRTKELGEQISRDYAGKQVHIPHSADRGAGSAAALIWPHGPLQSSGGIWQFESS